MEVLLIFIFIIVLIVSVAYTGNYWGSLTEQAARNKGYRDGDWYWKGFWRGERAFHEVVAAPDLSEYTSKGGKSHLTEWAEDGFVVKKESKIVNENEWVCKKCGRANEPYVGTCACGNTKRDNKGKDTVINQADLEAKIAEIIKRKTESEQEWIKDVQKEAEKADDWFESLQGKSDIVSVEPQKFTDWNCDTQIESPIASIGQEEFQSEPEDVQIPQEYMDEELLNIEKAKQYKELLDRGIISYSEYEKKRKELLDL